MRYILGATAMLGLVACTTQVPNSAPGVPDPTRGVGFGDPQTYAEQQALREAELRGSPLPPAGAISTETSAAGRAASAPLSATRVPPPSDATYAATGAVATPAVSDDIARDTAATLAQTSQSPGQAVVQSGSPGTVPQTVSSTTGISNENSFDAVGSARSINDDAQLLAQNRAQYQVVQPTALPSRSGATQPNVVQYALSTNHAVGTQLYSRTGFNKQAKAQRACGKYASDDLAQADFLAKGGPRKDRLGLDPDGDGFACAWTPSPFRNAVGG
ncbi:MAG: hypothetical protein AAF484_03225 [Pseudomonadota bacterium]